MGDGVVGDSADGADAMLDSGLFDGGAAGQQWAIPANLKQFAVVAPTKQRLGTLISLCLSKAGKAIVFLSSCASVDFHYDLLTA